MLSQATLALLGVALSAHLAAQDAVPSQLVEREIARSRACVPALARLEALTEELTPLARRAERLQALGEAIELEDSVRVSPFAAGDSLEDAVRQWFVADDELARQLVAGGGEATQEQRTRARDQIRGRVLEALQAVSGEGQQRLVGEEDLRSAASECEDAILIRGVVLEVCAATQSMVCEDARASEQKGRFAFVEAPADLWDVEQMRPWTDPTPLGRAPDGTLGGARTAVMARRGNVAVVVSFEPLIRPRSELSEAEIAQFRANADSLGISFDDPRYVMAPALAVQLNLRQPLGGETLYVLHFGALSDPTNEVVWEGDATAGEPLRAIFPAGGQVLSRLAAGEELSLTALKLLEGGEAQAQAVFSMGLTGVNQALAVGTLLSYMKEGQLARDVTALVPPSGETPP